MSEKEEQDYISLLKTIFHSSDNDSSLIYPIVKNSENISKLKTYLENKKIDNISKISLLKKLEDFFLSNNNLIPFLTTKYNSISSNFSFPIINLYLSEDPNEDMLLFLKKLLFLLNTHVSFSKLSLELIYQKLSEYYRNKGKNGKKKLTESLLIRYLHLLQIFYKDPSSNTTTNNENEKNENNIETEKSSQEQPPQIEEKQINNYIYFNGYESKLSFILKNNSSFPSLENGCSFFFWININEKLLQMYSNLYPNVEISLISLLIGDKPIKLLLKDAKFLKIVVDKTESTNIGISSIFQFNKWNTIGFITNKNDIKIYINRVNCTSYSIPNDFPINEKIKSIVCFNNLIGKISSLLFFSFPLDQKMVNHFNNQINYGFYKNKILFRFLYSIDNKYFSKVKNYNYIEKFKNEKNDLGFKILSKEKKEKNIISFFCPFAYNKNENIIDDIFGSYIALLSKNDGVNYFVNCTKNIKPTGGMSILLPIVEIMYSSTLSNDNISYNLIDKNILSEKSLVEFLIIVKILLVNHRINIYNANNSKFFSSLGLFLEKFPSKIYTEKVLDILIEVGKEIFQTEFDLESDNYINMVLLNEKIFSKFSEENQRKLWEKVFVFFTSDYSQMKDSLNISKICLLLRFYDEKRYDEYCCTEHAKIFEKLKSNQLSSENSGKEENIKVMNQEMGDKFNKLFDIIQLYIDKLDIDNESINLYKLLTLDISPCLQGKIIQTYIQHFSSESISQEKKENTVKNLLKNDYIEITEYALSISLLDIRIQILKLFKIIISTYYQIFTSSLKSNKIENALNYMGDNLLPNKLLVEIDCLKSKDDKDKESIQNYNIDDNENLYNTKKRANSEKYNNIKIENFRVLSEKSMVLTSSQSLVKYFNKDIYDNQIKSLYTFLVNDWLLQNIANEKKIISFVIDFCIKLVCELPPDYISSFSDFLFLIFNKNDIENKESLIQNKNIFPWLIETIFFFNNSENIKKYNDQDKIIRIQTQSLNLFIHIIGLQRPLMEIKAKIKYILDYSFYLKLIYKNDKENIKEISRITRLLLTKLIGSSEYINLKAEACFEFMIFYKNSEKLYNNNNINKKEEDITNNLFNKSEINENEQKLDNKINNDYVIIKDKNDVNNIYSINNTSNIIEENNEALISTDKNDSLFSNLKDSIPKYYLDGLYFSESNDNNSNKTLNEIWEDFLIYDSIIDYYYSNIWGIENICKKVKIEYNGNWIDVSKSLLEQYGVTSKKNNNILMKDILRLLYLSEENISDIPKKEKDDKQKNIILKNDFTINHDDIINIFNINIILLSIAIEITKVAEQKEFLEKQYQQFLIFCILSSININSSDKNYNDIQNILYNILCFGCLYLEKENNSKYKEIITNLIEPIIEEINNDLKKGGFKNIFGKQKKIMYKNTAVFRLFISIPQDEKEKDDIKKDKDKDNLKIGAPSLHPTRLATSDKLTILKKNNNNINQDDEDADGMTVANKKKPIHKNKVFLKYHGDDNIVNNLFKETLEKYKKYRENIDYKSKINYFYEINNIAKDFEATEEKINVKEKIKKLIPLVQAKIKQYSNTSFLQEKKRRNNYKIVKKRLFSWRGFWSDRYLFFRHPEYLKVKIKNHFTKEMVRPLLSPVLDINYYLPNFTKFNKDKLFNKNNYGYNIYLDLDEILDDDNSNCDNGDKNNKEENNQINDKKESSDRISLNTYCNKNNQICSIHGVKNNYGFNYLECLYKLNYEGIWDLYNNNNDQIILVEKKDTNIIEINNDGNQEQIISDSIKAKSSPSKPEGKTKSVKDPNKYKRHTLNCCIVKPTHHMKGIIITEKDHFQFIYEDNSNKSLETIKKENENNPNFDKDMGCCYGSIFKNNKKDKDNTTFSLKYSDIKYMFFRLYFYKESGLEIYSCTNKSYFLNFETKNDMNQFIKDILYNASNLSNILLDNSKISNIYFRDIKTEKQRILGYEQFTFNPKKKQQQTYYVKDKMEEWHTYMISTLEYLMWLNIYSGRSYNDLTQYPVIPWIISNYESKQLIDNKENRRDLSIPMGMIENDDKSATRKQTYEDTYDSLKNEFKESNPDFNYETYLQKGDEYYNSYINKKNKKKKDKNNEDDMELNLGPIQINQVPYYFGSHYSNPTYVSHYLTRIFPFSFVSIEIQGDKFDDPDRMFFCIEKTFESACTLNNDVRELIPEFYLMPEMFLNKNNLNLTQGKGDSEGKEIDINDVILPPWANNDPAIFVTEMRKILESDNIINKWIDLIFGSYQRGEKAEKVHNIYMAQTYEKMLKIEEITDPDYRNTLMRMIEIGVTPIKILFNDSKTRLEKNSFFQKNAVYSHSKGKFLYDCKNLEKIILESKSLKNNKKEIINVKWIDNDSLRVFTNDNKWYNIQFTILDKKIMSNDSDINSFQNYSSAYAPSYQMSSLKSNPFIVYGNSKYIIKGGFWDGRLELNTIPTEPKEKPIYSCIFSKYLMPINVMELSDDEKILICGTTSGLVSIYEVNGEKLNNIDNLFLHSDEITSISINTNLNMFATVSKDGYLNLYIMPSFSLVRSIKLSAKIQIHKKEAKKEEIKKDDKEDKKEENNESIKQDIIDTDTKDKKDENITPINGGGEIIDINNTENKDRKSEEGKETTKDNKEEGNLEEISEEKKNEIKEEENKNENIINDKENKIENKNDGKNNNIINDGINQDDNNEEEEEEEEEEQLYADNVFLSSSPLACVTVYISKKRLFRTYTINGEFVGEVEEPDASRYIKSPVIFKNLYFEDFLIYGTDKGFVKIRAFPRMNKIVDALNVSNGASVEILEISKDKRYCAVWSKNNELNIIKDVSVFSLNLSDNIAMMGFNIGK